MSDTNPLTELLRPHAEALMESAKAGDPDACGGVPAEVWPLAYYLAEEMQERGWKAEDVALRMMTKDGFGRDLLVFNLTMCVHRDNLTICDSTFAGLERAFEVSEEFFRRLDAQWRNNPTARVTWECPDELFGAESRRAMIRLVPK